MLSQPPNNVEIYDFSYARRTGNMRWRLYEDSDLTKSMLGEWECAELAGKAVVLDVNGATGNMTIQCRLLIEPSPDGGNIGFTYRE